MPKTKARARKPKRTQRETALMVGGGRMLLSIAGKLADKVNNPEKVAALDRPESASLIAQMAALALGTTAEAIAPVVDQFLAQYFQMLIIAGQFISYVNSDITFENFRFTAADLVGLIERVRKMVIVTIDHLDHEPDTNEVHRIIEEKGLRPATLLELLVWWLLQPEAVRKDCSVVALRFAWQGQVAYVSGSGSRRGLYLRVVARAWPQRFTFAAVRESQGA